MTDFFRALITAFLFLTRIPMPTLADYREQDSGRAFPLFPLVGLTLGVILSGSALLLANHLAPGVCAALILLLWVALTGGLHLDGLGDSADGWLAGGDKSRTLEIMKDPRSGSAAVIIIATTLLLKWSVLEQIITEQHWWALALTPMLARALALTLFLTTPYVSPKGIAESFLQHASRTQMRLSVVASTLILFAILSFSDASSGLIAALAILLGLRYLMMERLGGTTGDTSGAMIEWVEVFFLIGVLWSGNA